MTFPRRITSFLLTPPQIADSVFIAKNATVIGDVTLGEDSSVWFNATLRADINRIVIGDYSNIQDGAVVHVADAFGTRIGNRVTVGHNAIVHACTIEDEVLVGMGAIVMDGARIGSHSIIGAGALVTGGTQIPPGSLVLGTPARAVRELSLEEQESIQEWARRYVVLARHHKELEAK